MPPDALCPLCGGTEVEPRFSRGDLPLWNCQCGMVFLHPHPSPEELLEIYGAQYYLGCGIGGEDEEAARAMKRETFRRQLQLAVATVPPGRSLDVGCATGYLMEVAAAAGWEAHGVELSPFAAGVARRSFGDRVFNGTLEQAGYPDGHFDLVTLSDLLEHIPEPRPFLHEVRRVLARDGVLMIVTPDVTSLSARLMGRHWSHYHREHLNYFSPGTLGRLLAECGFSLRYRGGAAKCLTVAYAAGQLRAHPHFLLTPLAQLAHLAAATLHPRLTKISIPVHCGQMLLLAQKEGLNE